MGDIVVNIHENPANHRVEVLQLPAQTLPLPESDKHKCLTSITDKLSKLSPDTLNYGTVCIYKVPEKHRNKNQEAYTPRLVSIGFIHHGENQVQAMEVDKLKYLKNFMHTFRVSLSDLVDFADSQQKLVCSCYEDNYVRKLLEKDKTPAEVMLLDGVFIVELFLKNHFVELRDNGDIMFDNSWVSSEILHDLLLFENQLPFGYVHTLYDQFVLNKLAKWSDDDTMYPPSFNELAHKYFKDVGNTGKLSLKRDFRFARHFVEFLSLLHRPSQRDESRDDEHDKKKVKRKTDFAKCPSATELNAAGVKFRTGSGSYLLDVNFNNRDGVLTIPPLRVNDSTETFLRNTIAFEQSGYNSKYTTSSVIFLDNLIDTSKDVDLLIDRDIITNELGSNQKVADLFNSLYKEFLPDPKEFHFVKECRLLNDYSRNWWHKILAALTRWFAMLRRDYFSSPWSIISLIAAVIILGLTATQTAYSVKAA